MLKIGSCTVLYNPEKDVISNIESYKENMEICVIIDNSDTKNEVSEYFQKNSSYVYIDMHGNKGIAAALNKGIEYLYVNDFDFVLTMDQDSHFPTYYFSEIYELIDSFKDSYSLVGLNINQKNGANSHEIVKVPYWITSGNFVNIQDFYADFIKII